MQDVGLSEVSLEKFLAVCVDLLETIIQVDIVLNYVGKTASLRDSFCFHHAAGQ